MKIDASELPDWISGAQGQALTWRYIRPGYNLSVRAERFADAAVLQALAEQVTLTSVVADDGQIMTRNAAGGAQQRLAGFGNRTAGRIQGLVGLCRRRGGAPSEEQPGQVAAAVGGLGRRGGRAGGGGIDLHRHGEIPHRQRGSEFDFAAAERAVQQRALGPVSAAGLRLSEIRREHGPRNPGRAHAAKLFA